MNPNVTMTMTRFACGGWSVARAETERTSGEEMAILRLSPMLRRELRILGGGSGNAGPETGCIRSAPDSTEVLGAAMPAAPCQRVWCFPASAAAAVAETAQVLVAWSSRDAIRSREKDSAQQRAGMRVVGVIERDLAEQHEVSRHVVEHDTGAERRVLADRRRDGAALDTPEHAEMLLEFCKLLGRNHFLMHGSPLTSGSTTL